tara:strand:+ start:31050 stop:31955 length:906 start_codon:yes stop_codon:yes gene_type:complete
VQLEPCLSDRIWSLLISANSEQVDFYQSALEDLDVSFYWPHDHEGENLQLEIMITPEVQHADAQQIRGLIQEKLAIFDLSYDEISLKELPSKDWLLENRKQFPPIICDRFFIYPSFYNEKLPNDKINIELNAAMAFGSGEHETTKGCLHGLSRLQEKYSFANILDLGCGSGILAIAASKLWPSSSITAADFDHFAVKTTQENAITNKTSNIQSIFSDGFVQINTREFDLIIANILAGPLIELASQMYTHCSKNGVVVLSGLLNWQEKEVRKAYESVGFQLCDNFVVGEWATLVFEKSNIDA